MNRGPLSLGSKFEVNVSVECTDVDKPSRPVSSKPPTRGASSMSTARNSKDGILSGAWVVVAKLSVAMRPFITCYA